MAGLDLSLLVLRPLHAGDEHAAMAIHEAFAAEGFGFLWAPEGADAGWPRFLEVAQRQENEPQALGTVPARFLVAEYDGEIVGRTSIRFQLNEHLRHEGGHIGYGVVPAWRRRGIASELLRRSLGVLHDWGEWPALVTCNDDNIGSIKVIERLGGVLEDIRLASHGTPKRRYWIHDVPG